MYEGLTVLLCNTVLHFVWPGRAKSSALKEREKGERKNVSFSWEREREREQGRSGQRQEKRERTFMEKLTTFHYFLSPPRLSLSLWPRAFSAPPVASSLLYPRANKLRSPLSIFPQGRPPPCLNSANWWTTKTLFVVYSHKFQKCSLLAL